MPSHLNCAYVSLADNNALASGIQRGMKLFPCVLAVRLAGFYSDDTERDVQCLDQSRRQNCQGGSLFRHLRPFFVHGFIYVTVDQRIKARPLFVGKSSGE